MRRLVCSKPGNAAGPRLRLLNPGERPLAKQVRLRRRALEAEGQEFHPAVLTSGEVPIVEYGVTLAEPDKKARLLVAQIAGVGAAIAIGFLAAELFRN